jgi:cell division protein FtsB
MSKVNVIIKMTAQQLGALYMKNIALEAKVAALEAEVASLRSVAQFSKPGYGFFRMAEFDALKVGV